MIPKTFRVSDTLEWRWKIVQSERTGIWDRTLANLRATTRLNVLSSVGGSQIGRHLVDGDGCTMSEEYVGQWLVLIECIMVHNLKSTWRSTGNQWSCLRADVTCSFIRRSRISRAAEFWTQWSDMIADFGRMNECTSWAMSSCSTGRRIWRSRRSR